MRPVTYLGLAVLVVAGLGVVLLRPQLAERVLAVTLLLPVGYMVWGVVAGESWRDRSEPEADLHAGRPTEQLAARP